MKKIIFAALLFTAAMQAQVTRIDYYEVEEIIKNPERGYYFRIYSTPEKGTKRVSLEQQFAENSYIKFLDKNQITLIHFIVRLDDYINGHHIPVDENDTFIQDLDADFEFLRNNHLKCVLRFNYSNGGSGPYEASYEDMLQHIEDLTGVTHANQDVISSMEAGFIGKYGEWYEAGEQFGIGNPDTPGYNDPDETIMTQEQLEHREEVGRKIFTMTDNRLVAFRTPYFQKRIAPPANTDKLFPKYNGTIKSRTACHDDAFLNSRNDEGTFRIFGDPSVFTVDDTSIDRNYLRGKSTYTFTGGESNQPNENPAFVTSDPAQSYWSCNTNNNLLQMSAIQQMETYHYNYLNYGYYGEVIGQWQNTTLNNGNTCYTEIKNRLGYRFRLRHSTLNLETKKLNISLRNDGFGHVINHRPAYLVLQNDAGVNFRVNIAGPTDSDEANSMSNDVITEVRAWYPGSIGLQKIIKDLVTIDNEPIEPGHYRLFLELPDGDISDEGELGENEQPDLLQNDPGYSIRIANNNSYLETISVNNTVTSTESLTDTFWTIDPVTLQPTGLNNLFQDVTINEDGTLSKPAPKDPKAKVANLAVFEAKVSPNPFNTSFRLNVNTSSAETITINVFDMLGKLLENKTISKNELENLEIGEELAAGIYSVSIKQADNAVQLRVIKK